jgi:hypothetical protein
MSTELPVANPCEVDVVTVTTLVVREIVEIVFATPFTVAVPPVVEASAPGSAKVNVVEPVTVIGKAVPML